MKRRGIKKMPKSNHKTALFSYTYIIYIILQKSEKRPTKFCKEAHKVPRSENDEKQSVADEE